MHGRIVQPMSLHNSFPSLANSFDAWIWYIQDIPWLNALLLIGVVAILFTVLWKYAMEGLDFVLAVAALPFSPAAIVNATLGYYLLVTAIVAIGRGTDMFVIVASALAAFFLLMWDFYDRVVPSAQIERIRWKALLGTFVMFALAMALCVQGLLGTASGFLPFMALVDSTIRFIDTYSWLGLFLRFLGAIAIAQTIIRGVRAFFDTIHVFVDRCKGHPVPPGK